MDGIGWRSLDRRQRPGRHAARPSRRLDHRTGDRIDRMALPRRQRVAAYAVIVRDERILLSGWPRGSPPTSSGPCRAAGSTTARTRATRWSARSARRPVSTPSSASRPACTPPTRRGCGATGGAPTTTRCASCTTRGCRPTPRNHGWSRSTGPRSTRPGTRWRRARRDGAHGADGAAGAGRLGAVPDAAGGRLRAGPAGDPATATCCWCGSRPRGSTPARGACPAAASTTASGRRGRTGARGRGGVRGHADRR